MDIRERCERLTRCRAKFQEIVDSDAGLSVKYEVRKRWDVTPSNAAKASSEILNALATVAGALLVPPGTADDWWWHVAKMPGSTPRHPYEITEAARCSADALRRLELSLERPEAHDAGVSSTSSPRVARSR